MEDNPPGFRFFPTEEELVSFYLHHQLERCNPELHRVIPIVDVYDVEPWNLPKAAGERCREDTEQWFFFVAMQKREAMGGRPRRCTELGYWKATGSTATVYSSDGRLIGVKKRMVFYLGKSPTGRKTKWKMNEYKAVHHEIVSSGEVMKVRNEFSLCRVYVVSGSVLAFDRRPVPTASQEVEFVAINGDGGPVSQGPAASVEEASLPDDPDIGENFYESFPELLEDNWEPSLWTLDHMN